jgi:hypothetical protein
VAIVSSVLRGKDDRRTTTDTSAHVVLVHMFDFSYRDLDVGLGPLGVAGLSSRTTVYCLGGSGRLRLGEGTGTSSRLCFTPPLSTCSRSRAEMRSWAGDDAVKGGERRDMGQKRAHLEIPRTVTPSFRFHRLCKLEDIQSSTFLSARTASGFDD